MKDFFYFEDKEYLKKKMRHQHSFKLFYQILFRASIGQKF